MYLFKDSRDSLKAMQLSVQELNTNVATLIANDKSKAVTLAEHTQDIKELREDVVELKVKVKSGAKN